MLRAQVAWIVPDNPYAFPPSLEVRQGDTCNKRTPAWMQMVENVWSKFSSQSRVYTLVCRFPAPHFEAVFNAVSPSVVILR